MFPKRLIKPELLDHLAPDDAQPNLADLVRINRHFGGHSVLRKAFSLVAPADGAFTVLDIGAASGDASQLIRELYPRASVVNLDYNESNLAAAPRPKLLADAFQLPFRPHSFDYVFSSLFLHHFQDERVVELLSSFYLIARRAVVICDLERHVAPFLFLRLTKPIFGWGRITVHDGLISVRAAFTKPELLALARRAGLPNPQIQAHRPAFRLSLIAATTR